MTRHEISASLSALWPMKWLVDSASDPARLPYVSTRSRDALEAKCHAPVARVIPSERQPGAHRQVGRRNRRHPARGASRS